MILVYRGHGYLVMIVILLCGIGVSWPLQEHFKRPGDPSLPMWPAHVSMLVAGLLLVPLGWWMNDRSRIGLRGQDRHSFWFVPVEVWGVLLVVGDLAYNLWVGFDSFR